MARQCTTNQPRLVVVKLSFILVIVFENGRVTTTNPLQLFAHVMGDVRVRFALLPLAVCIVGCNRVPHGLGVVIVVTIDGVEVTSRADRSCGGRAPQPGFTGFRLLHMASEYVIEVMCHSSTWRPGCLRKTAVDAVPSLTEHTICGEIVQHTQYHGSFSPSNLSSHTDGWRPIHVLYRRRRTRRTTDYPSNADRNPSCHCHR